MLRFHENPPFQIQLKNRCYGALKNKFSLFCYMEVAFVHVLLPKIFEKGVFTSQNRQNSQIFPKKNPKKLSGKSAHLFLLHFLG